MAQYNSNHGHKKPSKHNKKSKKHRANKETKYERKYSVFIDEYRAKKTSDGYATDYYQHKKWSRDVDWEANEIIKDFIFLGGIKSAKSVYKLYEFGISYVLNCAEPNTIKYHKETIRSYCLNAKDKNGYNIIGTHLHEAIEFIEEARSKHAKILIHCIHGVNRSAAIVIGYLLYLEKQHSDHQVSIIDATKLVLDQRAFALTNRSFQQQLLQYEQYLNTKILSQKKEEHMRPKTMIVDI